MISTLLIAYAAGAVLDASATRATIPNACALLPAADASKLAGSPVTLTHGDRPGSINCVYNGPGGPASLGIEITIRTFANAAAAQAAFPRWVLPYKGPTPGLAITSIMQLGDEATVVRGHTVSGIFFRSGAVLVKIGAHPPVGDPALEDAARTVLGKLRIRSG